MPATPAELAQRDRDEAREREFDRKATQVAFWGLLIVAPVILYAVLALLEIVPPAPGSPLGG